ncbi:MAG: MoaD/ThiS family protein [Clostridiales Family XIII bacterium]|jgi:molybdopterin converting factor small subunit|nr:MoaD/ThiS family protein [Clostridiales Family XIII bacterium]
MRIRLDDLIGHRKIDYDLPAGSDIEALLHLLAYEEVDLFHTVNGRTKRYDFVLSEGDKVALIPVMGGG